MLTLKMKVKVSNTPIAMVPFSMDNINLYKSRTYAFFASFHRFPDTHISKFVTFKMYVNLMYHIRSDAIRCQIHDFLSESNGNVCIFPADTCQKKPLEKFDLENLGQGHWLSTCLEVIRSIFCVSFYRLRDINIINFWLWKFRLRSRDRETELTWFDSEYQRA